MTTQVFRGRTLLDARKAAIEALGKDAVVLTSREVRRRGLTGLFGGVDVEIAAAAIEATPAEPTRAGGPFAASAYGEVNAAPSRAALAALRNELRGEIRAMKTSLGRSAPAPTEDLVVEVAAVRAALEQLAPEASRGRDKVGALLRAKGIEGGASAALARVLRTKNGESTTLEERLRTAISELVSVSAWPPWSEGPTILAAVGPTGVGKTTTIAKLAARAKADGKSVTLITCDTFRVGGVEHLQRYAELLGVRCEVVNNVEELAAAVARARTDVVMVDTSGRAPVATSAERLLSVNAFGAAQECQGFARHVLLCMPAATRAVDASRIAKTFSAANPTAIAITKLDETDAASGVVHAAFAAKLPLSLLCAGQRVPEDIAPATTGGILDAVIPQTKARKSPHECNSQSS